MEAIMGVNAALITIYDLSKIVNPDLSIEEIRLLVKQGGKSGLWLNPNGLPEFLSHLKSKMLTYSAALKRVLNFARKKTSIVKKVEKSLQHVCVRNINSKK